MRVDTLSNRLRDLEERVATVAQAEGRRMVSDIFEATVGYAEQRLCDTAIVREIRPQVYRQLRLVIGERSSSGRSHYGQQPIPKTVKGMSASSLSMGLDFANSDRDTLINAYVGSIMEALRQTLATVIEDPNLREEIEEEARTQAIKIVDRIRP